MFETYDLDESPFIGDFRECLFCSSRTPFGSPLYQMFLCVDHWYEVQDIEMDELVDLKIAVYRRRLQKRSMDLRGRGFSSLWFARYPYAIGLELDNGGLCLFTQAIAIRF